MEMPAELKELKQLATDAYATAKQYSDHFKKAWKQSQQPHGLVLGAEVVIYARDCRQLLKRQQLLQAAMQEWVGDTYKYHKKVPKDDLTSLEQLADDLLAPDAEGSGSKLALLQMTRGSGPKAPISTEDLEKWKDKHPLMKAGSRVQSVYVREDIPAKGCCGGKAEVRYELFNPSLINSEWGSVNLCAETIQSQWSKRLLHKKNYIKDDALNAYLVTVQQATGGAFGWHLTDEWRYVDSDPKAAIEYAMMKGIKQEVATTTFITQNSDLPDFAEWNHFLDQLKERNGGDANAMKGKAGDGPYARARSTTALPIALATSPVAVAALATTLTAMSQLAHARDVLATARFLLPRPDASVIDARFRATGRTRACAAPRARCWRTQASSRRWGPKASYSSSGTLLMSCATLARSPPPLRTRRHSRRSG